MQPTILRNTEATLTHTFYVGGTGTDADGAVTVTITKADGTAIVTDAATVSNGTGEYEYTLAPQSDLDELTLAWSGVWSGTARTDTDELLIVSRDLFTIAQARLFGAQANETAPLASAAAYPNAVIVTERDRVTDLLFELSGVSWIERFARETFAGDGSMSIELPHVEVNTVLSVTIDGASVAAGNFDLDTRLGVLYRSDGGVFTKATATTPRNVVVEYEHGYQSNRAGVDRIALLLLRERLVPSSISPRATSINDAMGTITLVTAGGRFQNPTNLPEVNQWLADNHRKLLVG